LWVNNHALEAFLVVQILLVIFNDFQQKSQHLGTFCQEVIVMRDKYYISTRQVPTVMRDS
jgi:hypothetical protein